MKHANNKMFSEIVLKNNERRSILLFTNLMESVTKENICQQRKIFWSITMKGTDTC